ncbi:protein FAM166B [Eublepharis macularius]|uniref:Ciliary microtubule inner protein 2B n=1 Tax=Eublepharis macularius TaxID=481883 RepID=A0AA97JPM3_EUBMA|nr:protein FAM166B [Eublepharis macularius]
MATAFASKASQTLMTPEPHYLPGYRGHCPHYKFTLGQTYGKLTSQLLTCPEWARSGQTLLQPNCCAHAQGDPLEECCEAKTGLFACRTIPGYTGFIPRAQNYYAKTYCKICKEAGHEFARQLARGTGGMQVWQHVAASPKDAEPESELPPAKKMPRLAASSKASATGQPRWVPKPHGVPAAAGNDGAPQKYFVPGFTGFVPRARYLIGASYPTLTRRAWEEFGRMLQKQQRQAPPGSGTPRKREGPAFPPLAKTYPTDKGLLPHYKGYVPGYKFRFGHTYGHLTYDALGRSWVEKLASDRLP